MTRYRALTNVLLRYDLRDWATLIFTFLFPAGLLVALVLTMGDSIEGMDLTGPISANVMAFGAAFVGIFAGATHLALWRENGMFVVLRSFPISSNTVIAAQATAGMIFLITQALALFGIAMALGMTPEATAPIALLPLILGFLLFFMLGVLVGIILPSMAGVSMAAVAIIIPLGMIGGAMMPIETLPSWAQTAAPYTPIYHMREAVTMPLARNPRAKMLGIQEGFVKLFASRGVGTVLGGVVVAPRASELIFPVAIAVQNRLSVDQVAATFTVYPSLTGTLAEAARRLHPTDGDA